MANLATESKWVLHEASVALTRDKYAPSRIEQCTIPAPYNERQATDIWDWDGSSDHPGVRELVAQCERLMPRRRRPLIRMRDWVWARRGAAVAVLFAAVALAILVWQTAASRRQVRRLDELALRQQQSQAQIERSILRGYYKLEPLTIQFNLRYPLNHPKLARYVQRLNGQDLFKRSWGEAMFVQLSQDDLPRKDGGEKEAFRMLLEDETTFDFVDPAQAVDPDSRSFTPRGDSARGLVRLYFVARPESRRQIDLMVDNQRRYFIKHVHCVNPARTGDDVFAFSMMDLVGRELSYHDDRGGRLTNLAFGFAFAPNSENPIAVSGITFPEGAQKVVIAPRHLGLQRYDLPEPARQARQRYDTLSGAQKRIMVERELRLRTQEFWGNFISLDRRSPTPWDLIHLTSAAYALDGQDSFDGGRGELAFEQRSFKWLLRELSGLTGGTERESVMYATQGVDRLFELLVGGDEMPGEAKIDQVFKDVREKTFSEFGLGPWKPAGGFGTAPATQRAR